MANNDQNVGNNGKFNVSFSLEDILLAFNNPVNEEQAWSVCYQCAQYFQNLEKESLDCRLKYHELYKYGKRALKFSKDGSVFIDYSEISRGTGKGPPKLTRKNSVTGKDIKVVTENDAIQALGLVIYQALDYGLGDNEERHLGNNLEHLLELMINPDEDDETFNADDEGIEKDAKECCTFQEITVLCARHLTSQQDAGYHYKAVCRALAAEAAELTTFLDKVTRGNERLAETQLDQDLRRLDDLQRADWARLWVQMMRELRQGCRLKKVDFTNLPPVEYELTPFEILLEDIRTRRYTLNKIMVNGDIPHTVKSDAHAVMLDFIRSRPPLQPAKDRVLKSPPKRELSAREKVLMHIRSKPQLKSVPNGPHIVETSRTKLDNNDEAENPQPIRKVIKPDFNNLLLDSFEVDDDDDDSSTLSPKSRRSSLASPSPEKEVPQWRRAVVRDVVTQERHNVLLQRRNTITVCESPQVSPTSLQNEVQSSNREHDSKLKRSGPVAKSNACPNDLRKRLNEKLHGRSSISNVRSRRLHGSISEVPSETENCESETVKKSDIVKNESPSVRRTSSSRMFSQSYIQNKRTEKNAEISSEQISRRTVTNKTESDSPIQSTEKKIRNQRKLSEINKKLQEANEKHRELSEKHRESSDKHISVQRTTSSRIRRPVSQRYSTDNDNNNNSNSARSPRPHSLELKITTKRSTSPVSQPLSSSPISPVKAHVSTSFAGLTEISSSPIKMHASPSRSDESTFASEESDISLGRSLPSRRILVSRRSSMSVSKSCGDIGEEVAPPEQTLQRTQSVLDVERQRPTPKPRLSIKRNSLTPSPSENNNSKLDQQVPKVQNEKVTNEDSNPPKPVPRPRTKIVQRSQSQRPLMRHSVDLSQLSAIKSDSVSENRTSVGVVTEDAATVSSPRSSPRRSFRSETPDPHVLRSDSPSESQLSELDVNKLLHVSLNTPRVQETNHSSTTPCQDSRSDSKSIKSHKIEEICKKWNHPIECLSLNLEEVMHIRTVLTKAELESFINQSEFYNMLSKGKVCFTCKEVKFSMFGQWGNRCKICKRNVCNNCLRKMNIPTEHFQNIPVHTLSPIPLGQDALDILKVFESTGSVPQSPAAQRKILKEMEANTPKRKSLQRSQTFNSSPNLATPLPNKNLLKGPQMNVCCECKKMIMDIIRTSRTSIALLNKGKGAPSQENGSEKKSTLSASSLSLSVKNFFTQK